MPGTRKWTTCYTAPLHCKVSGQSLLVLFSSTYVSALTVQPLHVALFHVEVTSVAQAIIIMPHQKIWSHLTDVCTQFVNVACLALTAKPAAIQASAAGGHQRHITGPGRALLAAQRWRQILVLPAASSDWPRHHSGCQPSPVPHSGSGVRSSLSVMCNSSYLR